MTKQTERTTEPPWARMSSQELAGLVGRRHDDVMRVVETLGCGGLSGSHGRWLCRRDSAVVVGHLALEMTCRLADRWQEIEAAAPVADGPLPAGDMGLILAELGELRAALIPAPAAAAAEDDAAEGEPDWARCAAHLLAEPIDLHEGGPVQPVARWIVRAGRLPGWQTLDTLGEPKDVQKALRRWGIGLAHQGRETVIEIANRHQVLDVLFEGTRWREGQHRKSLTHVPGAMVPEGGRTMAGVATRVIALPIQALHRWLLPTA